MSSCGGTHHFHSWTIVNVSSHFSIFFGSTSRGVSVARGWKRSTIFFAIDVTMTYLVLISFMMGGSGAISPVSGSVLLLGIVKSRSTRSGPILPVIHLCGRAPFDVMYSWASGESNSRNCCTTAFTKLYSSSPILFTRYSMKYCDVPVSSLSPTSAPTPAPYRLSVRLRDVRRLRRRDVRRDRLGRRECRFDVRRVFDRFFAILPLQYLDEKTYRTVWCCTCCRTKGATATCENEKINILYEAL